MATPKNLSATLAEFRARLEIKNPDFAAEYQVIVDRLAASNVGSASPRTGDKLPDFQLPDANGRLVSLSDLLSNGPLVVSVNRGHWCDFCRYELTALQDHADRIAELGASVVAISPETQVYAKKLRDRCGLTFPVLCDVDNGYALSLGLAIWVGNAIKPIYEKFGYDLDRFQGNSAWMLPIPATYVVATDGRIADCLVDPDFRNRMEPVEVIAALKAL